jgi:Uma2 family endonuclease
MNSSECTDWPVVLRERAAWLTVHTHHSLPNTEELPACYDSLMVSPAPTRFTETEYLALERASAQKHEFVDGAIVAMAGARPAHNMLAANVTAALVVLTRGRGCVTMTSDQRVHVPTTRLYTYPDVTVACGERRYDDGDPPSLLNPTALVEVTSDSTEDFDRGTKFLHYQAIAELREYLIVSHRERRIDHFRREGDGRWRLTAHTSDDALVELPNLGGAIALVDVYAGVELDEGRRVTR